MSRNRFLVLTSINSQKMTGVIRLIEFLEKYSLSAIVVADKKTPTWTKHPNIEFLDLEKQEELWPELSAAIPFNHYARKNLGYLYALSKEVDSLLDTDDDNCPMVNPWEIHFDTVRITHQTGWINIYKFFGESDLWPRGLPLDSVHKYLEKPKLVNNRFDISCFQSIVDGDPDIDAIGRMLFSKKVSFSDEPPVILTDGICPTNSQATVWSSWVIPLLYLPSTATFRMTDIWRGLILQSVIKNLGGVTVFGKLGFEQDRNEHNLMRDFESEIDGHIHSREVYEISEYIWSHGEFTRHPKSILEGLEKIYRELVGQGILDIRELSILNYWSKAVMQSVTV